MRRRTPRTLRSTLAIWSAILAMLAFLAAGALTWISASFNRMTEAATSSVESVFLLEEAEIDLLLHRRASDELVRRDLAAALRRKLAYARDFVGTTAEAVTLADTTAAVEEYLAGASLAEGRAYSGLEASVAINLEQARAQQASAESLGRRSAFAGVGLAILLIVVTSLVLVGARRRALLPMLDLAGAMRRFGAGERGARAEEAGYRELNDMSAQFNAMAEALGAQRESQLALIAGVAHDLRQPLSALELSLGMLSEHESRDPEVGRLVGISQRQLSSLHRMVGDFLEISRLESGRLELAIRREELRTIVRDVVEQQFADVAHDRLRVHLPRDPVEVDCDAGRVAQAIHNLVSNALKYSPPSTAVEISVEVGRDEARVAVADRGPGLSRDEQARVFEPFTRLRPGQGPPGIGLGLYLVRRIAEALGGRVEVDSVPRSGSRFTLVLPRRLAESTRALDEGTVSTVHLVRA